MSIQITELDEIIERELGLYSDEIVQKIKKQAKKTMNNLVKKTKATAPVGQRAKHYKDHITSQVTINSPRAIEYQWYVNGSDYRLSHLLNNGHALRGGGRYAGTGFISDAEAEAVAEYEKAVEEIIENG